ncbi:hypothetical protein [Fructilactobacillus florum]|nr:hypothetical protein [Fructilactobacillus florum]
MRKMHIESSWEKIIPTKPHLKQVLLFVSNSGLTIFGVWLLMIVLPGSQKFLLLLLVAFLYLTPLLTGKKRFTWETNLHKRILGEKPAVVHDEETITFQPNSTPATGWRQRLNGFKKSDFTGNLELWSGLLALIIGVVIYTIGRNRVGNLSNQLLTVIQSGSLSTAGYYYFFGGTLTEYGILASIGGLLKGVNREKTAGTMLKTIGVIMLLGGVVFAIYVYTNPIDSATKAWQNGLSLSDMQNMYSIGRWLPWLAALFYVLGIGYNLYRGNQLHKTMKK